jgi:hypothetical protein
MRIRPAGQPGREESGVQVVLRRVPQARRPPARRPRLNPTPLSARIRVDPLPVALLLLDRCFTLGRSLLPRESRAADRAGARLVAMARSRRCRGRYPKQRVSRSDAWLLARCFREVRTQRIIHRTCSRWRCVGGSFAA